MDVLLLLTLPRVGGHSTYLTPSRYFELSCDHSDAFLTQSEICFYTFMSSVQSSSFTGDEEETRQSLG